MGEPKIAGRPQHYPWVDSAFRRCAETAAMLFLGFPASDQITVRRVDGWQTLERSPADDFAA